VSCSEQTHACNGTQAVRDWSWLPRKVQIAQTADIEGNPIWWDSLGMFDGVTSEQLLSS